MQQIVKQSLRIGAAVADTSALVLGAVADRLRRAAGDQTPAPPGTDAALGLDADHHVDVEPPRADRGSDLAGAAPPALEAGPPHETRGQRPAAGTRTRAAVANPKAARKLRSRNG